MRPIRAKASAAILLFATAQIPRTRRYRGSGAVVNTLSVVGVPWRVCGARRPNAGDRSPRNYSRLITSIIRLRGNRGAPANVAGRRGTVRQKAAAGGKQAAAYFAPKLTRDRERDGKRVGETVATAKRVMASPRARDVPPADN